VRARLTLWFLVFAGGASAAPSMVVAASGDCKDADLLGNVRLLTEALRGRTSGRLLTPEDVAQKLGPQASKSVDDLQRQVDLVQTQFYQGDRAAAERAVPEMLVEIERLPPSAERWKMAVAALLLQSQIDRERGKQDAADEAFRRVLRLEPAFQLDPDYFAPSIRKHFDKLRTELARSRKEALAVRSSPSGAEVFLDGKRMGQTPFSGEVPPGTYQVILDKDGLSSFAHGVIVKSDLTLHVDLKFEGAVLGRRLPCMADADGEGSRLANAVKLAAVIGADQVVVGRLEHQTTGPAWFAALMVDTATAQKVREGGLKVERPGTPPDGLEDLADFIVTGQPSRKVLTEPPAAAGPLAPALKPDSAAVVTTELRPPTVEVVRTTPAHSEKTGKTPAGYVLGGAGLVLGAGAIYFAVDSSSAWTQFNAYYATVAPTPDQLDSARSLQTRARNDVAFAWTGAALSAAALGGGAYFLISDHAFSSGSGFGFALSPTPTGATVLGRFP
jgi:hypothetical protein